MVGLSTDGIEVVATPLPEGAPVTASESELANLGPGVALPGSPAGKLISFNTTKIGFDY